MVARFTEVEPWVLVPTRNRNRAIPQPEDVLWVRKGLFLFFIDSLLTAFHMLLQAVTALLPAAVDYASCAGSSTMTQLPCFT